MRWQRRILAALLFINRLESWAMIPNSLQLSARPPRGSSRGNKRKPLLPKQEKRLTAKPVQRYWRLSNVHVPLSEDPGKDEVGVSSGLVAAVASVLSARNGTDILAAEALAAASLAVVRKSFDARYKRDGEPKFVYTVDVALTEADASRLRMRPRPGKLEPIAPPEPHQEVQDPAGNSVHLRSDAQTADLLLLRAQGASSGARTTTAAQPKIVVIGSGPAGLFAALALARAGLKPLICERGRPVEQRGRDIGALTARKILDPDSNLCFGEGGAGTWSDGKLTTRIGRNSGPVREVLKTLVDFGAPSRILIDGKPHLGTDRLVRILQNMRADLIAAGAEFAFETRVESVEIKNGKVTGVLLADGKTLPADGVVLAIGHSSRPLYSRLLAAGVKMEPKPIAVGFRIEHPQQLIDEIQLGPFAGAVERGAGKVPVADYRLAAQIATSEGVDRGCYSFCMCPGGQIVLTSVDPSEICVNGMSFSKRASRWANAALVATVDPQEMLEVVGNDAGSLAGVEWQRLMEREAAKRGGGDLVVPVQRVTDFLEQRSSGGGKGGPLPSSSYRLGVKGAALHDLYPPNVSEAIAAAIQRFETALPGFVCKDALLHGVETRTSAPVQITRKDESLESVEVRGLYPAGEGAGYAGGIVSSAVDGLRVGLAVAAQFGARHDATWGADAGEKESAAVGA